MSSVMCDVLSLTAEERELTVIDNEAEKTLLVSSTNRKWITQLEKNKYFSETQKVVNENGRTISLIGTLPKGLISIRNPKNPPSDRHTRKYRQLQGGVSE